MFIAKSPKLVETLIRVWVIQKVDHRSDQWRRLTAFKWNLGNYVGGKFYFDHPNECFWIACILETLLG